MNALEKSTPLRTSSVRDPARSKGEFTKSTDHDLCLGYLRSDDCDPAPEMSQFPDDSYYSAATPRLDLPRSFGAPKEKEPVYALQNHARLALQLTRHFDEAMKAGALAERSRIAHDVHDTLAQCLTGIYAQLEAASQIREQSPEVADACIRKAKNLSHKGLQEVRRLVTTLQADAAQRAELAGNLRKLADKSSCDARTKVLFNCKGAVRLVSPDIGYQLLQIGREAVGNALRYAKARSVRLRLGFTNVNIELSIEDDGIGFRPDTPTIPEGFGFSTMRRRASRIGAKFTLRTSPGTGTAIRISAPCPAWSYRL
jgi:signal transduction histidine kinase